MDIALAEARQSKRQWAQGNLGIAKMQCQNCGVWQGMATKFMRCSGCTDVHYCSKACQHADWPRHKKSCKRSVDKVKTQCLKGLIRP